MQIENREEAQRSILQMCRGAFQERVDYEMPHLMENIFDPNTAAKAKRKVTIKAYLEEALKDMIDDGSVVVMM